MTEQESLLEFPCRFPVKAMGRQDDQFRDTVVGIILRHAATPAEEDITENPSSAGKFVSVTVRITATSRAQLDAIYQDLTDCPAVLMAL